MTRNNDDEKKSETGLEKKSAQDIKQGHKGTIRKQIRKNSTENDKTKEHDEKP